MLITVVFTLVGDNQGHQNRLPQQDSGEYIKK
jgi:hypothetical protein